MPRANLNDPGLYLNRELSILAFNQRVLEQAADISVPLLERLRFLSICGTNLDEFFEVRVAGIKQQVAFDVAQPSPDGLSPHEILVQVRHHVTDLIREQYRILNEDILPGLEAEGIRLRTPDRWTARQALWAKRYFRKEVLPVLAPVGLDPAHPFPQVMNKALNFIVRVEGKDAYHRDSGIAVIQIPRSLPRLIAFPGERSNGPRDFTLLSSLIEMFCGDLFPGLKVQEAYSFRVTRDSELFIDEEETEDLLHAVKGELPDRNRGGAAVRLEVTQRCSKDISQFLLTTLELSSDALYVTDGPVNLSRIGTLYERVDHPELKFKPFVGGTPRRIELNEDLFSAMRRGDILLHQPFETFTPVVDLVRKAAADPTVVSIRITLYRTGTSSPIVAALLEAARAGKEVTAVVELRARFDEEANIDLATALQEAGANVAYGVVGFKTHTKMLLVVRREGRKLRRYVHLGTGNYHAQTARFYTDFGLLTADPLITDDVHKLFVQLIGLGREAKLRKLSQAPFTLNKALLSWIQREITIAQAGRPAYIVAKMNALSDPGIIRALYKASQAGVSIDLLVRGVCCLRPGVPGVSDNIRVRSIVGRFLEHSRVFYFYADGKELVYLSSADWMTRNLHRRVEICFPIEDERLKNRVIKEGLMAYLEDNTQAWRLDQSGNYQRLRHGKQKPKNAQLFLLHALAEST